MGYRSVVAFCLKVKEPEQFVALLKTRDDRVINEILENSMYGVDRSYEYPLIHFFADHWKWYDESEKAFTELMNMAESYDKDFACRFARFGEEMDDTVEEGFGEQAWDLEYPYVDRVIETGIDMETAVKIID